MDSKKTDLMKLLTYAPVRLCPNTWQGWVAGSRIPTSKCIQYYEKAHPEVKFTSEARLLKLMSPC